MKSPARLDSFARAELIAEIEALEKQHSRELVGATVERYLSQRRWFSGEIRTKIARGCDSLRQSRGVDGETVMAELLRSLMRRPAR